MKKVSLNFVLLGLIFLCVFMYGCNFCRPSVGEEELVMYPGRDGISYIFSDKVRLWLSWHSDSNDKEYLADNDSLGVRNSSDEDWRFGRYDKILTGNFKKFAWNEYTLFILMDDIYYTFDIKSYQIPEPITDEDNNIYIVPEYSLDKYSLSEFAEKYPDYENFNWRTSENPY